MSINAEGNGRCAIEVSTNQNRTIYAGLSGAGSPLPAAFPIIAGTIIEGIGF